MVIAMSGGQVLQAQFLTPIGIASAILIPGQFATLEAHQELQPLASGSLQPQGSQSTQQLLDDFTAPLNLIDFIDRIYVLPAGTHSIGVVISSQRDISSHFYLYGDNDLASYISDGVVYAGPFKSTPYYFPVLAASSPRLHFRLKQDAGGMVGATVRFTITAILDPLATIVQGTVGGVPIRVAGSTTNDLNVIGPNNVASTTFALVNPNPVVILVAFPAQTILLHHLLIGPDVGVGGAIAGLEDTSGVVLNILAPITGTTPVSFPLYGVPVPVGKGVQIKAPVSTIRGTLIYSLKV